MVYKKLNNGDFNQDLEEILLKLTIDYTNAISNLIDNKNIPENVYFINEVLITELQTIITTLSKYMNIDSHEILIS